MAIAVDSNPGADQRSGASVTSFNYSGLTIGAGLTNSAAVFAVTYSAVITAPSATWNAVSCPLIGSFITSPETGCSLFGIVNPASGNKTFALSWTTACQVMVAGISFTGVLQTGGATTFPNFNSSGSTGATSSTLTVTTVSGDYTIGVCNLGDSTGVPPLASVPAGTQLFVDDQSGTTGVYGRCLFSASTGTSTTYTGKNGTSDNLVLIGCSIVPAAASVTFMSRNRRNVFWR